MPGSCCAPRPSWRPAMAFALDTIKGMLSHRRKGACHLLLAPGSLTRV